ncbi:hypothetical protein C8R47DRAFT_114474 [Mycena vitilis]|nr:hypothetical protein C8R47DRAFT_114474 [Mycena vitilis]
MSAQASPAVSWPCLTFPAHSSMVLQPNSGPPVPSSVLEFHNNQVVGQASQQQQQPRQERPFSADGHFAIPQRPVAYPHGYPTPPSHLTALSPVSVESQQQQQYISQTRTPTVVLSPLDTQSYPTPPSHLSRLSPEQPRPASQQFSVSLPPTPSTEAFPPPAPQAFDLRVRGPSSSSTSFSPSESPNRTEPRPPQPSHSSAPPAQRHPNPVPPPTPGTFGQIRLSSAPYPPPGAPPPQAPASFAQQHYSSTAPPPPIRISTNATNSRPNPPAQHMSSRSAPAPPRGSRPPMPPQSSSSHSGASFSQMASSSQHVPSYPPQSHPHPQSHPQSQSWSQPQPHSQLPTPTDAYPPRPPPTSSSHPGPLAPHSSMLDAAQAGYKRQLENTVKFLEDKVNHLTAERGRLLYEQAQNQHAIAGLDTQLQAALQEAGRTLASVDAALATAARLRTERAEVRRQAEELLRERNQLIAERDEARRGKATRGLALNSVLETHKRERDKFWAVLEGMRRQNAELQALADGRNRKVDELRRERDELRSQRGVQETKVVSKVEDVQIKPEPELTPKPESVEDFDLELQYPPTPFAHMDYEPVASTSAQTLDGDRARTSSSFSSAPRPTFDGKRSRAEYEAEAALYGADADADADSQGAHKRARESEPSLGPAFPLSPEMARDAVDVKRLNSPLQWYNFMEVRKREDDGDGWGAGAR